MTDTLNRREWAIQMQAVHRAFAERERLLSAELEHCKKRLDEAAAFLGAHDALSKREADLQARETTLQSREEAALASYEALQARITSLESDLAAARVESERLEALEPEIEAHRRWEAELLARDQRLHERLIALHEQVTSSLAARAKEQDDFARQLAALQGEIGRLARSHADQLEAVSRSAREAQQAAAGSISILQSRVAAVTSHWTWRWTQAMRPAEINALAHALPDPQRSTSLALRAAPASPRDEGATIVVPAAPEKDANRSFMTQSPSPGMPPRPASSVGELLSLDGLAFLSSAYLTLLKRPIDEEGLRYHLGNLESGIARAEVLRQLANSPEGKERKCRLPGLRSVLFRAAVARLLQRLGLRAPPSGPGVDRLLQFHGEDFVRAAYQAVLRREPDPEGYRHFCGRLQQGTAKWRILADLANSREAAGRTVPGLRALIRRQRLQQIPAIGSFWATPRLEGRSANDARLRASDHRGFSAAADAPTRIGPASAAAAVSPGSATTARPPTADVGAEGTLRLDEDFGIGETRWSTYLEALLEKRLREPMRRAANVAGDGALWICVSGEPGDEAVARTLDAIARLDPNGMAIHAMQVSASREAGAIRSTARTIADVSSRMSRGDQMLFLCPGDLPMRDLPSALRHFGAFRSGLTVVDMFYRDGGRAFPVLLHGFDPVHAAEVDYVHSRFLISSELLKEVVEKSTRHTPRDVMSACLSRHAESTRALHIPIPLLEVSISSGTIDTAKAGLARQLGAYRPAARENRTGVVSAVICTKDSSHLLQQLMWRLLREPAIREVVIVSNNTSNPFALGLLDALCAIDRVHVLHYDRPFNFSSQCNLGARHASGSHLLFINDDVVPVSDDWIDRMLDAMGDASGPERVVGPMLLYPDQSVQHAGMHLGFNNVAGHSYRHARLPDRSTGLHLFAPRCVSALTGAAMLMSKRFFEAVNGFDPMLATYLQDVDLSLRALNSGAQLILEPRAILFHMESISIKPELPGSYMSSVRGREYEYFARRWASVVSGGDEWWNPRLDPADESARTLRI